MTIKVGDRVPAGVLTEFIATETEGCSLGPNAFKIEEQVKGKKIAVFAVPGAFTPACSNQHVPGYLQNLDALKAKGVQEVWCVAVNDPFVMGAWAKDQGAVGKIRFMADGSGIWTKALGLELDLTEKGLGVRSQRYSMLLDDGVVKQLNLEGGGQLEVSTAEKLLDQI